MQSFNPKSSKPWKAACTLLMGLCMGLFMLPAKADVWGYVDVSGVAHFSAAKLDARYELFFRGQDTFSAGKTGNSSNSGMLGAAPSSRAGRSNGLASGPAYPSPASDGPPPAKLLAFFDVSPSYKAVKHLIREASGTHGMDYELLQALIATESGFNTFAVSPKGAVGLMQLMPPTAERYGVKADKNTPLAKKLTDPQTNIRAGATYLRDLIKLFPAQLELAVAAYNAGEGAVQRAGNKIPNYPETQNYVKTVMQLYGHLKPPNNLQESRKSTGRVRFEMMGGATGPAGAGATLAAKPDSASASTAGSSGAATQSPVTSSTSSVVVPWSSSQPLSPSADIAPAAEALSVQN